MRIIDPSACSPTTRSGVRSVRALNRISLVIAEPCIEPFMGTYRSVSHHEIKYQPRAPQQQPHHTGGVPSVFFACAVNRFWVFLIFIFGLVNPNYFFPPDLAVDALKHFAFGHIDCDHPRDRHGFLRLLSKKIVPPVSKPM